MTKLDAAQKLRPAGQGAGLVQLIDDTRAQGNTGAALRLPLLFGGAGATPEPILRWGEHNDQQVTERPRT